eukprot:424869-Rhodomonas_salina.2
MMWIAMGVCVASTIGMNLHPGPSARRRVWGARNGCHRHPHASKSNETNTFLAQFSPKIMIFAVVFGCELD